MASIHSRAFINTLFRRPFPLLSYYSSPNGPTCFYSSVRGDTAIRAKINKEMKEIYEFFRRPSLHFGEIRLKKDEHSGIALITFDYPPKRNAISGSMMADLWDAVQELSSWDTGRAVILRGANGIFSSGADLDFVMNPAVFTQDGGRQMAVFMSTTLAALRALPLTSVALVERVALGGAAEIAGAADFRVLTEDAFVSYLQSTIHIAPGWGGMARLVSLVGQTHALELLLSGRRFTAREGLQMGYVQHIVPKTSPISATSSTSSSSSSPKPNRKGAAEAGVDPVLDACLVWLEARVGAGRRPEVVRAIKSTVHAAAERALEIDGAQMQLDEVNLFAPTWSTSAHRQAIESTLSRLRAKPPPSKTTTQ